MKRTLLLLSTLLLFSITAFAQSPVKDFRFADIVPPAQSPAKPEENAQLKPLVTELTSAQEALNAKLVQSPEAKAVNDAKAAYDKAVEALNKSREKLPEFQKALTAEAKVLDFMYQVQAAHGLSSREFRPVLNDKGELAFVRSDPPKPQP